MSVYLPGYTRMDGTSDLTYPLVETGIGGRMLNKYVSFLFVGLH